MPNSHLDLDDDHDSARKREDSPGTRLTLGTISCEERTISPDPGTRPERTRKITGVDGQHEDLQLFAKNDVPVEILIYGTSITPCYSRSDAPSFS